MAYIVSTTQTATANAATYTVKLGAHVSGDLLLVKLSQDGGGTAIAPDATSATAGWSMIGTQAASGASRSAWAYLIADSSSEVNPVFTGATDDWIGTCLVVRDAHATAPFGSLVSGTDFVRTDWNNVASATSAALTSAVDECLLIYSWNADGSNQYLRCVLNELSAADKYATTNISHIIGHRQQQTAAAAPTVTMHNVNATEGGNGWVLAIRNKSGGALQPDLRPDINELQWHGTWAANHDGSPTWQAPSSFSATINGITCSTTVPTVSTANSQAQTPWGVSSGLSGIESAAGCWAGGTFTHSSTDMSGRVFTFQFSLSAASGSAIFGNEGVLVGFSDGTYWVVYQVLSKEKTWLATDEMTGFVAVGQAVEYANSEGTSSSSINWTAITRRGYFVNRATTPASNLFVKNSAVFAKTALTGGGVSRPATFNDYNALINSWGSWKWSELQGSAQVKPKSSVQIGDGANVTYFDGATGAFGFPQAWSAISNDNWQMDWNVNPGRVGLFVKASASDTIKLAAGAATSANAQLLTIDAASSTSATYDFGQAFGGFVPTLKTGITETGTTFTGCGKIDAKGSSLTSCTIKNTTATDAAIAWTENGATVTGTTITVSATTSYHMETGASVTAITLADVTFTGTPGTDKVHVLATTGTVTITISGTTSLAAADVTSAGAAVVISAPVLYQSVAINNITTTSRVQIYDTSKTPPVGSRELYNGVPGATSITWTDSLAAVASRSIRVRIADVTGTTARDFIEANIGTCGVTSGTQSVAYLANQTNDTTYNTNAVNGSLVTGITFTDAATDLVNVNLSGGSTTWKDIYAAFAYWISTAAGIDDDIAYVDAVDPANYLLTAMKVKNTTSPSVPLTITGGFGRSATTGSIVDIIDTTGGNIYPLVDHVVVATVGSGPLTATQDAKLMGLPSATTTASATLEAAATTPIAANIKQVNSLAVDGSGTEADPWGPQ